jgi:hypothetical protein
MTRIRHHPRTRVIQQTQALLIGKTGGYWIPRLRGV